MDFRHRAICRDEDPELFFPVGTSGPALLQIAAAKTVCRRCPVVSECLAWALDSGQTAGVWGGMSEDERRALKRRNTRRTNKLTDDALAEKVLTASRTEAAEIGRNLLTQGLSPSEVATKLDMHIDTVRRWARTINTDGERIAPGPKRTVAGRALLAADVPVMEVAHRLGVSESTVRRWGRPA